MDVYNPAQIEGKWRSAWEKYRVYRAQDMSPKSKFYILDMFPYPSGSAMHVGHCKGYIASDVIARMRMMQGYNVLHPMGWDAFGLPAENFAIKNKIHPAQAVRENIIRFKSQLEKIGFTYDWDREINTTDPQYYKWTQWQFKKMFEAGLVRSIMDPVNYCPNCKTVLANEDVEDGKCERCLSVIERKPIREWEILITKYADRLLNDLDKLDWEESILEMQRNWIGRSEGAEIIFKIKPQGEIKIFTTRLDTIFGCTYCVVAPEHNILSSLRAAITNWDEVENYLQAAKQKTDLERTDLSKEKTGVELKGVKAINPFNNEEVKVFVGDYVLGHYGTGAIMAVPAHDERDFEFAKKYNLEVKSTIIPNLGNTRKDLTKKLKIVQEINDLLEKNNIKVWFNGTVGVAAYYGRFFDEPADIDCGVLEQDFDNAKKNIESLGYDKIEDKENEKFKVSIYTKNDILFEIGTFDHDLGNNILAIEDLKIRVPEAKWFANCYRITSQKERRKEKNDLDRAIFLEEISGSLEGAYEKDGILINSGEFFGLSSADARKAMINFAHKNSFGDKKINYKMRDWVFARQRYWGEPIPLVYCGDCAEKIKNKEFKEGEFTEGEIINPGWIAVPDKELPVKLPEVESYEPAGDGQSPLAKVKEFVETKCPKCGGKAQRETNTMPQWAGSCWYYLRYIDPQNNRKFVDLAKEKYWSPVNLYIGGSEHATRHLLYARFWHKFLFDHKYVNYSEPFQKLQHVGLILGEDNQKMSKRWGNVVNPDDVIVKHGADALRVYEMFMGPFGDSIAWSANGVIGAHRFLEKVWNLDEKLGEANQEIEKLLHQTIKKVESDFTEFKFNTALAQMMIFANKASVHGLSQRQYLEFVKLLAPIAPHMAEEIWQKHCAKNEDFYSIFQTAWPIFDENQIKDEKNIIPIQINGKLRARIEIGIGATQEQVEQMALDCEDVKKWIKGKQIKKVIYVKGKMLSIII